MSNLYRLEASAGRGHTNQGPGATVTSLDEYRKKKEGPEEPPSLMKPTVHTVIVDHERSSIDDVCKSVHEPDLLLVPLSDKQWVNDANNHISRYCRKICDRYPSASVIPVSFDELQGLNVNITQDWLRQFNNMFCAEMHFSIIESGVRLALQYHGDKKAYFVGGLEDVSHLLLEYRRLHNQDPDKEMTKVIRPGMNKEQRRFLDYCTELHSLLFTLASEKDPPETIPLRPKAIMLRKRTTFTGQDNELLRKMDKAHASIVARLEENDPDHMEKKIKMISGLGP